ncbi:sensor histidine kinase [Aureliella helgolandensis]|uniref:histidine kinase n=1 Tax=Aureliella helgolandensis TaxID=2527968 RepID=A0A518G6V3_9BACT|nr:HAMP domain-containing sensor histidine kinase [Aureliella helgolandensis]QDV24314.1 Wide host range VirA protein [Aureliella helgolandensis]
MQSMTNTPNAVPHQASIGPVQTGGNQSADVIQALQAQLEHSQRMAALGELTSTTTHEFNNLLMTILNYAKVGMRNQDNASRDKAFQRIYDAATRAAKVTNSVLSMARSRSGAHEPTCLKQLIEDTLLLLEREFRKFRIALDVSLEDVPAVLGSASDLQRVIVNLLVNARQATPEQGQVRVSLTTDPATNEVLMTIRDTGTGIPPQVLPKIFEPFFSTKLGPDSTGKGGTGVGLSSCKETIDAHKGRIRVESTVGKGTAFMIRLPATDQPAPKRASLLT